MDIKKTTKIFKALSNENRLEIYLQIVKTSEQNYATKGECFISEMLDTFNIGAPTISHHLKKLSNAELIFTEKKGKYLIAKVNKELVNEVFESMKIKFKGDFSC